MIEWDLSDFELGQLTMAIDLSGTFYARRASHRSAQPYFKFERKYRDKIVEWIAELLGTDTQRVRRGVLQTQKGGIEVIRLAFRIHCHLSQQRQEQIQDMLIECHEFVERAVTGFHSPIAREWRQLEHDAARWARRIST